MYFGSIINRPGILHLVLHLVYCTCITPGLTRAALQTALLLIKSFSKSSFYSRSSMSLQPSCWGWPYLTSVTSKVCICICRHNSRASRLRVSYQQGLPDLVFLRCVFIPSPVKEVEEIFQIYIVIWKFLSILNVLTRSIGGIPII